jgi:uncharacterized membrane protein
MARLGLSLLIGIFGAAAIHIVVLFLVPRFSESDLWSRLAQRGDHYEVLPLGDTTASGETLEAADPLMRAVACRFDLADNLARLTAPAGSVFWSLSVFDRHGLNVFSLNDRTADAAADIVFAMPFQAIDLRKAIPDELAKSIIVEVQDSEGIAVLRTFQPDWTYKKEVDTFLSKVACAPV